MSEELIIANTSRWIVERIVSLLKVHHCLFTEVQRLKIPVVIREIVGIKVESFLNKLAAILYNLYFLTKHVECKKIFQIINV